MSGRGIAVYSGCLGTRFQAALCTVSCAYSEEQEEWEEEECGCSRVFEESIISIYSFAFNCSYKKAVEDSKLKFLNVKEV